MPYLKTPDNIKVSYDYYPTESPRGYLLLLHMMPATKESWKDFAMEMTRKDYASLVIDLRGHGESDGGPSGYQNFSDEEHQRSILDVEAAVKFLKEQGAPSEKIVLIGASIGANLALWYLAEHPEIKTAVLLSAGLNYRGIRTEPLVKKLKPGQKLLLFSARDDAGAGEDNPSMNKRLIGPIPVGVQKELIIFEEGGHGTDFLESATPGIEKFLAEVL